MIVWLAKKCVLAMHDRQIAEHGGSVGVRDENLFESALARPQQLFAYGDPALDLADLAATLAFGLARNPPFVDGNKRTAAVACEAFIRMNDGRLEATDLELYPQYLALAEGRLSLEEFAAWLRARIRMAPKDQVQEPRRRKVHAARR
ncbi:MAG: type II toxin-antitoxin system death-on-curing family toxin [Gammaproteobacteria bacterium]|nr:type II toxin-antitoxin system death-on-curing family toxin [Gammaproteobacteria bacterium]